VTTRTITAAATPTTPTTAATPTTVCDMYNEAERIGEGAAVCYFGALPTPPIYFYKTSEWNQMEATVHPVTKRRFSWLYSEWIYRNTASIWHNMLGWA
jgi:hypothetical protein